MENQFTCAICENDLPLDEWMNMPCCGKPDSTMKYCRGCLHTLISLESNSGVGRCPTCRTYFAIQDGIIRLHNQLGRCRMCRQNRQLTDPRNQYCEKCALGNLYSFRYECKSCHKVQSIPHPMWQYQSSPDTFGTATWACHKGCATYTNWRITAEDVSRIPLSHAPDSWGTREEWIQAIRSHRRQLGPHASHSPDIPPPPPPPPTSFNPSPSSDSCFLS